MADRAQRLCVCFTPLHVLIARRIAEARGIRFSAGLYLTSSDNAKQRHYADAMRGFCARVELMVLPGEDGYLGQKHVAIWKRRVEHLRAFRRFGPVDAVYAPTSSNHYLYALLSAVRFRELVTFDDGLVNVNPDSPLFRSPTRLRAKLFLLAAGVRFWPERIRARASHHYSIYDMDNICSPVSRIPLVEAPRCRPGPEAKRAPAKILFGPAPEVDAEVWGVLADAARRYALQACLPHPRETRRRIEGVEYVETPLVAEDYVLDRLQADPGLAMQIYGYDSSALVNLARTPRVEVFSLLGRGASVAGLRVLMERSGVVMID